MLKKTINQISAISFCLLFTSSLFAQFEEPDNLIYGTITGNGVPITSADTTITVEVRKALDGSMLASYTMGDEEELGDFYRVKVSLMNDDGAREPDELIVTDSIFIVVKNETEDLSDVVYVTVERGKPVRLDLTFTGVCTQAIAGVDQQICGDTTTLAANTAEVGTGSWHIMPSEGGVLGDSSNPLSSFSGTRGVSYILQWQIHHETYIDTMDDVSILFVDELVADAGSDQVLCSLSGTMTANAASFGTGLWTVISGVGGSFDDIMKADTIFHGQPGESYILNWTLDNGHCDDSTDNVTLKFMAPPEAGMNQFVCGVSTLLTAVPPVVGTGHWEIISGPGGGLIDMNDPITAFHGVEGVTYEISWIVNGTDCQLEDRVQVTFSGLTSDIFVENPVFCGLETPHSLYAQVRCGAVPYTYTWSVVSGPLEGGDFSNPTAPNPTFTPLGAGIYEIQLVVEDLSGGTTISSRTIYAPELDVDGIPGVTNEDFMYRVFYWYKNPHPSTIDLDENGIIDIRDLLVVLPCHSP